MKVPSGDEESSEFSRRGKIEEEFCFTRKSFRWIRG
jgi:hypothetical protein